MSGPGVAIEPAGDGLNGRSYLLIAGLAVVLVAGFVVLAALGRDTTSYMLFLGGPAATAVLGAVLNRRVGHVAAAVDATQQQTTALVTEQVSGLDSHLHDQDQTLNGIAAVVQPATQPAAPAGRQLPAARERPVSPFGPVQSGLVRPGVTE